jgi:8-oxo-dGTP pyrophosphatase MutT (NUDIX family)
VIKYVLGFAFDNNASRVVLIEKKKPEFLKDYWNGVGGKVEETDLDNHDAMVREFEEETGVHLPDWVEMFVIDNEPNNYQMWVYHTFSDGIFNCRTTTDERVQIVELQHLDMYKLSANVRWFIEFALSSSESFNLPINIIDNGGN